MLGFSEHVSILADACKSSVEQMTKMEVIDIEVKQASEQKIIFPFAHIIEYTDHDKKMDGTFTLAFREVDEALKLSSAISQRLGIGVFTEVCEDSTDLLNEFLNVVVGRTISEWDKIGLTVNFNTPVFIKNYKCKKTNHTQAYTISMRVSDGPVHPDKKLSVEQIVLRLDFMENSTSKIRNKKILLVDDSKVMRRIIATVLKEEGAKIEEAGNGEEAIAIHKSFNPDLTLMDINMPKMGGFEAIMHIREFSPDSKFIILSSSSRKDEILNAKTLSVSGYLVKPTEPEELIKRVSGVL